MPRGRPKKRTNSTTIAPDVHLEDGGRIELPPGIQAKLGSTDVQKGIVVVIRDNGDLEEVDYLSWDVIDPCLGEDCPAFERCDMKEIVPKYNDKCVVQLGYMMSINSVIISNFNNKLTEAQMMRIGFHLMPLYRILIRLKILEMGTANLEYISAKGEYKIKPIVDKIVMLLDKIEKTWDTIGLKEADRINMMKKIPGGPDFDGHGHGYYEMMSVGHFPKPKEQRLIKRHSKGVVGGYAEQD
jgi:hypothetical protein